MHLAPPGKFALPPLLRGNPFVGTDADGAWVSGGLGFRWDEGIAMRN